MFSEVAEIARVATKAISATSATSENTSDINPLILRLLVYNIERKISFIRKSKLRAVL